MALAGPRLDRPSAIGDEGRPRATSLTIASLTVVALFGAAGWALGSPTLLLGVGTLVGLVAAGMGLQNRAGLVDRFVGNLCLLGAGSLLTYLLITLSSTPFGLVLVGFTTAMLALALTWANVANVAGFRRALEATAHSFVAVVGWFVVGSLAIVGGLFLWALLTEPAFSREPILALSVFGLAVSGAGVAISIAVDRLPIVQLTARSNRERAIRRVEHITNLGGTVAKAGVVFMLAAFALPAAFMIATGADSVPFGQPIAAVVGSPFVIAVPVLVGTLALVSAVVAAGLRAIAATVESANEDVVPAAAAGLAFLIVVPVAASGLPRLLLVSPGSVALLLLLGPLALLLTFALVIVGIGMDLVPDRAGGPALAGGALFVSTVGAGLLELPTPLVLATAAGALVVWDVSTFGLGVTAELGHRPETRRLELFHGVLAVGVGVAAVVVLTGVDFLRQEVVFGAQARLAAAVAVAGVLVAIVLLRR